MENLTEIVSVPVIAGVTYLLIKIYKYWVKSEKGVRIIPGLAGLIGIILGLFAFKFAPDIMPAENFLMAMLIGGASGFSATGVNQLFKQLGKDKETTVTANTTNTPITPTYTSPTLVVPAMTLSISPADALTMAKNASNTNTDAT